MSTRRRVTRLERNHGDAHAGRFFRLWDLYRDDPRVTAATEALCERLAEVETALGRPLTVAEWLDAEWLDEHGLAELVDALVRVVGSCGRPSGSPTPPWR